MKTSRKVLDACAMLAYLRAEDGAEVVKTLLKDQSVECFAHAVNLCEVYYDFLKTDNAKNAKTAIQDLIESGVTKRDDMDSEFWMTAGRYKAEIRKISLADCFALALTNRLQAELITSDHHEFCLLYTSPSPRDPE